MASYLATVDDRRVRHPRVPTGRHPLLGRDRSRPARHRSPRRARATSSPSPSRPTSPTSGWPARSRCRPGGAEAVVLGQPRHRAAVGLLVRRGPHASARTTGRPSRTSTATAARTPGAPCPFWHEHPPVPRPTTRRTTGDGTCAPPAPPASGGPRPARATAGSSGHVDLSAWAGKSVEVSITYASDDVVQRTASSSTTSSSRPARHDIVRGRRRPVGRLDGPGRPGRQPGERERLDRRDRRRHAADAGAVARARSPGSPRSSTSSAENFGPIRSRPRAVWSTISRGSGSPSRTRPGRIYAKDFFTDTFGRQRRRPRARPPVVRRQRRGRALAATSG